MVSVEQSRVVVDGSLKFVHFMIKSKTALFFSSNVIFSKLIVVVLFSGASKKKTLTALMSFNNRNNYLPYWAKHIRAQHKNTPWSNSAT